MSFYLFPRFFVCKSIEKIEKILIIHYFKHFIIIYVSAYTTFEIRLKFSLALASSSSADFYTGFINRKENMDKGLFNKLLIN